MLIPVVLSVK